ncbi:hypothetical protein Bca4012_096424 [Brassica carinata]
MPRMHYGRRNTREYAQRCHYDMEGNLVLPIGWLWRNVSAGVTRFQFATEEGPPRKRGRPCKPPSAAGGPPRVFTGKCQCGVLIKNAQEDRSVAGYTEDFINQAKLCKPKNAETWCVWYKSGLRFAMEAEEKIAADVAALSSMEGGNPGRDVDGYEVPVGELAKGKRGRPRKPPTVTCDCDVLVGWFEATQDIREELVGVRSLWNLLVRRMANQALHAEEWLAESEAEAEYDRVAEAMKTLDPRPRPRHVNVARRYPRDES